MPLGAAELRVHPEQNGGRNEGVFSRAGVLQKHFRRDELLGAVVAAGLQVEGIVRSCHFLDLIACARPLPVLNKRCVQIRKKLNIRGGPSTARGATKRRWRGWRRLWAARTRTTGCCSRQSRAARNRLATAESARCKGEPSIPCTALQ